MDEALEILDEQSYYDESCDESFVMSEWVTKPTMEDMVRRIVNAVNAENVIDV